MYLHLVSLHVFSWLVIVHADECQFLTRCKCTNFPLFTLLDTSYLSKPRSTLNQDLFCTYAADQHAESSVKTFEQLKYFYYRFRTLTFANYPQIPTRAFRFVHFESQSVKQTARANNRNVIALINIAQTQPGKTFALITNRSSCAIIPGMFEELNLADSQQQLMVSFLNSPALSYVDGGLSHLACYELKLKNTNPQISIDFFRQSVSIDHLIIDNPSFAGFLPSSDRKSSFTFQLQQLSIKDISVRHLQSKHFPPVFITVQTLTLENHYVRDGFRSFNSRDLAERFPQLRSLTIFSRSIQKLVPRMFEHLTRLEYLILDGITTVENEAFANLHHLEELDLGKDLRRLDPYAFIQMTTKLLLLNQSVHFQLNDEKDFCTFAQFTPSVRLKTFVRFSSTLDECSCSLRYLFRHLDKSLMSWTPSCYSNASLYVLTQEERICHFEQRLLQCDILPDEGITIYGQFYNVSYFYQQQISKQRLQWSAFFHRRVFYLLALGLLIGLVCLIVQQHRRRHHSAYRHLNRLLKRRNQTRSSSITASATSDIIYHPAREHRDPLPPRRIRTTKV